MENQQIVTFRSEIESLKQKCKEYTNQEEKTKKDNEDKSSQLQKEIDVLVSENTQYENEIEKLQQEFTTLEHYQKETNEEVIASKEKQLNEMNQKNIELQRQVDTLKQQSELFKDQIYLSNIILYWTPQAMFKYIQAYDKQSKN